jgi:DNA polymerase-1
VKHPWQAIWAVDFEFATPKGGHPVPLCVVARDLNSGRVVRQWINVENPGPCPYGTGADDLFLAYYASAEIVCILALGWPVPARIVDLCAEFKNLTSGLKMPHGRGQLAALMHFGLEGIGAEEKAEMQQLAASGVVPEEKREALLDYCASDVDALARLWPAMRDRIDLPRALIRGRYMAALARVERNGIPLDAPALAAIREAWPTIRPQLIEAVDRGFGVYDGETFSMAKFEAYLVGRGISWPRTATGRLELADKTFKARAELHPELQPLRQLRDTLGALKLFDLDVGDDGRNRTILGAFGSKTGRNQPSNTRFIFGPAAWVRYLIRPEPGMALAYIDFAQQEFAAAAALSGDTAMLEAYRAADPYLAFARMAGAVPADATKASHPVERERFKVCALAVQYGMGAESLAASLNLPAAYGRDLLGQHKRTFPTFWRWVGDVAATAAARRRLVAAFGWQLNVTADTRPTTLQNWPCQAAGAEMLRLAIIAAVERGIRVCAPVHDALLIEAPVDDIEAAAAETSALMTHASRIVLGGEPVRTDVKIIRWPERYVEPRGAVLWQEICRLTPSPIGTPTCPQ